MNTNGAVGQQNAAHSQTLVSLPPRSVPLSLWSLSAAPCTNQFIWKTLLMCGYKHKRLRTRRSFKTYGTGVSYIKGFFGGVIQHLTVLNTYGKADKRSSLSRSSLCSRSPFLPAGTEWEARTRGRYSFLNHHRLNRVIRFPPRRAR